MRLLLAFVLGCTPAELQVEDTEKPHPRDSGGADTADTADSGDTGPVIDTGPIEYDCAALPEVQEREMDGPKAYHDVAFDGAGHLIGSDTQALLQSTYDGTVTVLTPGVFYEGIDRLPDGDLVATDSINGLLVRIDPDTGATSTIATGLAGAYGITIGPDGNAYVGNVYAGRMPEIVKVEIATGTVTSWLKTPRMGTPRMVQFGLDSTDAYVATIGTGAVYHLTVDADLMPSSDPELFATVGNSWHDSLGMDACGNLYVAEYNTSGLYRVTPDGTVTSLVKQRVPLYGHGMEWGSGIGGWRADALYQPQPYDNSTVREVIIGVPTAASVRTW